MTKETHEKPVQAAVGFSFNFNLDGTRENYNSVVAQFHLPLDFDVRDMHGYVDKIVDVVDRQRHRYKLADLQRHLKTAEQFIENASADIDRIHRQNQDAWKASGKQGTYKPASSEKTHLVQARNNIENTRVSIDKIKAEIRAVEAILSDGTASATDH